MGGYERLQEDGSLKLLSGILDNPGEAYMTIKRFTSGTLLNIIYGKTYGKSDEDLHTLLQILRTVIVDIHPFRHWVDAFPTLDWLPDFLAPWRAEALRKGEFDYQVNTHFYRLRAASDLLICAVLRPSFERHQDTIGLW